MPSRNELTTAPNNIITSVTTENRKTDPGPTTAPGNIITSVAPENGIPRYANLGTPLKRLRSRVKFFFGCRGCRRRRRKSRPTLGLPEGKFLLPKASQSVEDKICLVVDLDETLVHSSFKASKDADFIVPVLIEYHVHKVYVKKRPYVDHFIDTIGPLFECVLFTASLSKYADPLLNLLDKKGNFRARLFRESCIFKKGFYMKNLDLLGRELSRVIILDNSPHSYINHKRNAIPVKTWIGDPADTELLKLLPLLKALSTCDNVYNYLPKVVSETSVNFEFQDIFSQIKSSLPISNNNIKSSNCGSIESSDSLLSPSHCGSLIKTGNKHLHPRKVKRQDNFTDGNMLLCNVMDAHMKPRFAQTSVGHRTENRGKSRSDLRTTRREDSRHSSPDGNLSETFPMVHSSASYRSKFVLPRNSSCQQVPESFDACLIFSPAPLRNISTIL